MKIKYNIYIIKILIISIFAIIGILLWGKHSIPFSMQMLTFQKMIHLLLQSIFAIIYFTLWLTLSFTLMTNYIQKRIINNRIQKSESALGSLATIRIISYCSQKNGKYINMKFKSSGITVEEWNENFEKIQSAINYTIIDEIEYSDRDFRIIKVKAIKGRNFNKDQNLYDEFE